VSCRWLAAARRILVVSMVLLISGCKVAVYHNLSETESNEMLAVLLSNHISADKQMDTKGDTATLMVEQSQLAQAISVLGNHGYPKKEFATVDEIFPPGQLITSPEQQQVKVVYAKEQQLDQMLSMIPGVISANVQLTESSNSDNSLDTKSVPPTASVLIVYSPDDNVDAYTAKVRSLIRGSVPELTDENLSVVMIPADNLSQSTSSSNSQLSSTLLSLVGQKESVKNSDNLVSIVKTVWHQYRVVSIVVLGLILILMGLIVRLAYLAAKYRSVSKNRKLTESVSE